MTLNRDQLIKLLNLTGSEYDAEALNAIRRANALLRQHRATWADLLAPPQEPAKGRQPEPTQAQHQRPRPGPTGPDAFEAKRIWEPKVRHARRRRKQVAMLVPIFGATVVLIWVFLVLAVAQLMGLV
jgi:hypothetical protein